MRTLVLLLALVAVSCSSPSTPAQSAEDPRMAAWRMRAQGVTIIRDDWGIPHIYGKTDADVVFGLMYAQAEDDFNRVETNFLNSMGRLAEAEGEAEIWRDLRMKLFIDPEDMKAKYQSSPDSLRKLMDGWADGLNFYLATHPQMQPRVIKQFEPWMALTFSEGSIGGDIERVSLAQLEAFYATAEDAKQVAAHRPDESALEYPEEPTGSNGFAIAPPNSASGKALLWINPHTSFFFREEAQLVSEEGLNAYGALTWGQFFVYQGFNDRAGWMHTSSGVDNIDEYLETVVKKDNGVFYKYGGEDRAMTMRKVVVPYKTATGMAQREFMVYRTHRGPIVRAVDGKWVSVRLMEEPVKALTQSYTRTKARNLKEFRDIMEMHTNSSNNTVFADAEGNIAYFHSNFVPKRDPKLDWGKPVDGSNPATDWQGVHTFDESPNVVNPKGGWIQNTNNWPYSAAGAESPKESAYPRYFDRNGENPRGVHAVQVLQGQKGFTVDSLRDAAFDSYQPELAMLVPSLVQAYDQLAASSPLKAKLKAPVELLRRWDFRWGVDSVANSVAIFWGEELWRRSTPEAQKAGVTVYEFIRAKATPAMKLDALGAAVDQLAADFGKWDTPWGDINRFQRLTGDIVQPFDDQGPSIPVGFTSARWGSLASYGARPGKNTKKWYGTSGNSFVAGVEFGDRVRAKAVTAGGLNSAPSSHHFNDQAERYATGNLRDVYFYREDLKGHIEREYHPGEETDKEKSEE
jgi:acyl-homoserine-lactone acylase